MAKDGFKLLDSDMHVFEPHDVYVRHMDPKWGERIPKSPPRRGYGPLLYTTQSAEVLDDPVAAATSSAQLAPARTEHQAKIAPFYKDAVARGFDPVSQLQAMEVEGLDVAVLFRTRPLSQVNDKLEPEYATAICAAWNNWIADFCKESPGRLKASALIPLHDIDLAVKEAQRAVKELGAIGLCLAPRPMRDEEQFHDSCFDPLWAEAERLNVPICFHPASPSTKGRFRPHPNPAVIGHTLRNPMELIPVVACFCAGGVLEKFPRLRVAFLEGNSAWLPWLLYRLDEMWEKFGEGEDVRLEKKPSDYFLRQCFISVDVDEVLVEDVVKRIGDDNLIFSSDYPHDDAAYPNATTVLMKTLREAELRESSMRKIMWDNCARLYNLS